MSNDVLIISKMKNEGPFILEWIAHNLAIGIDKFLIYSNDCTDGTDTLLDALQSHGIVQHRQNPFREMKRTIHKAVYAACKKEKIYKDASWHLTIDVDEFINIQVGDGKISDLLEQVPDANMISMTWRLFGNSNITEFTSKPKFQSA